MVARCLAISLHDVAPSTWSDCERLLQLTDRWALPVTLLVVPNYHRRDTVERDSAFVAALKARVQRGDEVVLHGYCHLDEGPPAHTPRGWFRRHVLTRGEAEMAALERGEAAQRIAAGVSALAAASLRPMGFIAPAWQLGAGAREALRQGPLGYTATRDELIELPGFASTPAPSLVYSSSSAWRRGLSRLWNEQRRMRLRSSALLRVALHPIDARHGGVLRHWRQLIGSLAAERSAVLESRWLAAHRAA